MEMDTEKLGGGLVNLVLGALILWVAQTTFQHSGELAGVDQKFASLQAQQDTARDRLDALMESLNNRTRSRFTREDGEKLTARVDEATDQINDLERRIAERVNELKFKVIALQTKGVDQRELSMLRTDLARLNASLGSAGAMGPVSASPRPNVAQRFEDGGLR